jgi:ribosomal protein S18 acetylase RimI-like enzyme
VTSHNGERPPYVPSSGQLPPPHGRRHVPLPAPPAGEPVTILKAGPAEVPAVTDVIATAFAALPQSQWLVAPTAVTIDAKRRAFRSWCEIQVRDSVDYGDVYAYLNPRGDLLGAALWQWAPGLADGPTPDDYRRRVYQATGSLAGRFGRFERCLEANSPPPGSFEMHLWMLGVHPAHQGRGIGSALLAMYHAMADSADYTVYLEAAESRSRALYLRHGYVDAGPPFKLPDDGPPFYPMLRKPRVPGDTR